MRYYVSISKNVMRTKLIAGNWKMHLDPRQSRVLVRRIEKHAPFKDVDVVVCPTALSLAAVADTANNVAVGVQNIHYQDEGAFTGEISASMAKQYARYAIVGHSERRQHFGETDAVVARKMAAAVRNELVPIMCIGENLFQRLDRETKHVIHDQLMTGLTMLTGRDVRGIAIAYEPIWAIGTGDNAKPEQVKQAVDYIRGTVSEMFGKGVAEQVRILYGGSVKAATAPGYLKLDGVDGVLVGGASLVADEFINIIDSA